MKEIWKDIKGFEGLYQVSNLGNVKSLNYLHTSQERLLKLALSSEGYLTISLNNDNTRKTFKVHRLVAQAFIENPDNKPCIDHINTIKTDNRVDNLRWVTQKENNNNPLTREHLRISNIGNASKKVFCENTIYDSITQCAEHYNVHRTTINKWIAGTRKMPANFQAKGLRYYIEE